MPLTRFRQAGRIRGRSGVHVLAIFLAGVAGAGSACYPKPMDPVGVPSAPSPYVRLPYVQHVTDSSAAVLWMPQPGTADTAWYRVPDRDSTWTRVPVTVHPEDARKATLAPLPPMTVAEYLVSASGVRAGPHRIRTAPSPGAESEPVRVLLFGDSGWGGDPQVDLARRMERQDWDLSIHVGDIAYNDGTRDEFTERHFRVYARTLASTPFYPSVGNHDVRADEGRSYDEAFLWPEPIPGARYFSFRWGRILFVSLDTSSHTADVEGLRSGRGRQFEWLQDLLADAAADSSVEWIITFQHHPLYSHAIGISGHGLDQDLRANLLPLFERYGVDLVTAGHDHHYEREWPIRQGRRVPEGCGPVHVLSGGGGASRYARDITNSVLLATAQRAYQFVELVIGSDRIEGRAIGRDGAVLDEFTVVPYGGTVSGLADRCSR